MSSIPKRRLIIVTELFYPDETSTAYILSKIADKMSNKYEITVITGYSLYDKNQNSYNTLYTINNEIKILRVTSKKRDKNNLIQRTKKLIFLSIKLSRLLWREVQAGDKVLTVTNPAPLLIFLSWIKIIKKFQFFVLVHDVFPENTIPTGIIRSSKSIIYIITKSIFENAYAAADCLIVLGRDMKSIIERKLKKVKKLPRIEIIENWGDTINISPSDVTLEIIANRHKVGMLTLQYAGNVGRLQGLENVLTLLSESSNNKIFFDIWGDGALRNKLEEQSSLLGLKNRVKFHGCYSRNDQNIIINSSDLVLVTLESGMYGLGVPSKTYNILSAGKPILFIGDLLSEIALLIKEEGIGFCFSPKDEEGIVHFLNNLNLNKLNTLEEFGKRARIIAETKYSENIILTKFSEVL